MYHSPPITGVVQELFCPTAQHLSLYHKGLPGQKEPVNFTLIKKFNYCVEKKRTQKILSYARFLSLLKLFYPMTVGLLVTNVLWAYFSRHPSKIWS